MAAAGWAADERKAQIMHTPGGVRFGLLGEKPAKPAPTLLVLASSLEDALGSDDFVACGKMLAADGYICVALDVPCHGQDVKPGEPAGLDGWRYRLERGDQLVEPFASQVSAVLDYLVAEGYSNPERLAAAGTSRGGFIALHVAALEPRIKCIAAFAPVTDLRALREFDGLDEHQATAGLSLIQHADKLAGRAIWLVIGNRDERVDTDQSIALTRAIVSANATQGKPLAVELHVGTSLGHSLHPTAHAEAATWFRKVMPAP